MRSNELVTVDPGIVHGTPVFAGTRVPVETLFQWLEEGYSLNEFVENFPSVTKDHADRVLAQAYHLLVNADAA